MVLVGRRRLPIRLHRKLALAASVLPFGAPCQPVSDDGGGMVLEEIIVTARKIEEDLFRVPISVQSLSGDFVDTAGLTSLFELQFDVPGLVVTSAGMFGAGLALRGVTDAGGGNLAVAPHANGVYLGTPNLALARMFDVERVEVLKGPQGTLYGRNATGGSINVISRAPENEFSAEVESALGSFDTARVRGHINVSSEKAALRIAMTASEGDGFIRNSVDRRTFAQEDYAGIRASLRAQPTERLTVDLTAQHIEDDGASGELWLPRKDFLVDPRDIRLTTVTAENPHLSTANDLATADLSYALGKATLRSITGYARNVTNNLDDCAGLPQLQGCIRGVRPMRYEQWSQELHVHSSSSADVEWLVGLFLLEADDFTQFFFSLPAAGSINDYAATRDENASAIFGHATHRLNQRWSMTGGMRLSRESIRVASAGTGLADNPVPLAADGSWDNASSRIGIQYAPADHTLIYANVATGFKSGGVTTEILPTGEFDSFDPEEMTAYELGLKLRRPDRRWSLLASAFVYDFKDMQVRTTAILANRVTSVVDNAADARIHGVDLSAAVQPSDRLTFSSAVVWMPRREFVEFQSAVTGDSLAGNDLHRAPEWTASLSLNYLLPIPGRGVLSTRIDYNYRSKFFFTKENDPLLAQDAFGLLNLFLRYESIDEKWYLFASARNALDTDYFNQMFIQSSPGYPANHDIGFGLRF